MSKSLDVILDETEIVTVDRYEDWTLTLVRCGRCGRLTRAAKPTIGAIVWAAMHDCPQRGAVLADLLASLELVGGDGR